MAAGKVAGPELDIHRLYMAQKNKMDYYMTARQKATDSLQTGGGATTVWNQHVLRNVPTKRAALQQGINRLNSSTFGRLRPSPLGGTRARPLGTSRSMSAMSRGKRFHQLQDFLLGEDFFQDDDDLALTCMKLHEVVVVGTASKMSYRETKPEEKLQQQQNVVSTTSVYPVQLPAIEGQKSLIEPMAQESVVATKRSSKTGKHLRNKLARRQAPKTSSRAWEQPRPKSCNVTESSDLDSDSNAIPQECQPQTIEGITDPRPKSVSGLKPVKGVHSPNKQCTDDASTELLTASKSHSLRSTNRITPPVLKLSPLTYFEVDRNNLCISDTLTTTPQSSPRPLSLPNRVRRASEPAISVVAPPEKRTGSPPRKSIIRSKSTDGTSCDSSSESEEGRPETKRCARTVRFMGMEVKIYAPDAPVIEISHKG
uniref:Uncharacterized protein n=1 Tax=Branchiostoma floridae TaxID=7739 RepID=C3Y9H7_BRAFL|eukprot:XP_002607223.1 hypothetical protein BRAFLDRAFT_104490 [Branchiostoma floridae]